MDPKYSFLLLPVLLLLVHTIWRKINLYFRSRRFAKSHQTRPVKYTPQLDPFFALDHFFKLGKAASERRYLEHIHQWFGSVAPTFGVKLMGDDMLFTNEPKNVQAVLVTKFPDFEMGQRRRDNSVELLGVGVFNADGQIWEHSRALVRPNFSKKQVADLEMFEKHVQVMMGGIPLNEPVDLQEWAFRFTLDTGTEVLFSESSGVLHTNAGELAHKFAWAFGLGVDGISQRIRLGKFARLYYNPKYSEACKVVHDYVDRIVYKTIEHVKRQGKEKDDNEERYTFLTALAKEDVPPKLMRDHALNILVAARDTSACLMSSAFYELAKRPGIQDRLRQEISKELQGRKPIFEEIKNLKYLSQFIKETLRLHPPIPLNARVANKDTTLPRGGGSDGLSPIFIEKGKLVVYQVYSMHRRTDIWGEDAEEFKPERWETMRPTFEFLPFNAGPRICPGQQFALIETSYVIIRFLQQYSRIESRDGGGPWTENLTLTCSVGQGVWAELGK